ncbi:multidrug ABC transporter substrate-binding protein [Rhodomicrobium udaipurense JA643]|uniref:ABC transporter permease n=1 Tax=Rhodomicrobium udaipurense TaxID=1202716 RepID=A0A8I1GJ63_9HYPH|nr:ABC transporter permease [Rhodomicrobium udaipurense]KAI96406.1 multidrug ABC transporter substrate-binding protein [Rhodomicrobium udaipurense JA643]MBJ7544537.1 ABC transporter permease [Rhodomicrobium udaipurense]
MVTKLAIRNLVHDRARFLVTLIGILFAVVLLAVQLGLYLGARKMIVDTIDHANGDIWIAAYGSNSFEQATILHGRERFAALSVPGVTAVEPVVASFAPWTRDDTSTTSVVVVGSDGTLPPWNVAEGSVSALSPDGVAVDRTYADTLGISGVGSVAEINGQRLRVDALTEGIRSFTTSPYIFMSLAKARELLSVPSDQATFYLAKVQPGVAVSGVKRALETKLPGTSIFTKAEFRQTNLDYWLFGTGAGVALLGGAVLGLIIGTVVVAQTLYSSTKDHLAEFATLRALGSSSFYIHKVILTQATVSAFLGYALGIAVSFAVAQASLHTPMPIMLTPQLAAMLLVVTVVMCAVSALSSIFKVTKIDPAMVFAR